MECIIFTFFCQRCGLFFVKSEFSSKSDIYSFLNFQWVSLGSTVIPNIHLPESDSIFVEAPPTHISTLVIVTDIILKSFP